MALRPKLTNRDIFLKEYSEALADDTAAIFVGAGVSMAAGYPSWKALLRDIGQELGVDSGDVSDLAALAQWHIRQSAGATRIRQVLREEIGVEKPIPPTVEIIARLPIRHIWTTNYDRLIERAFSGIGRPLDVISAASDIALKPRAGAVRLYKMHGSVDRLDDVVISTDDYELFRSRRGAFLPLLHAHLASLSLLFVGLSLTDPNVRHVLSSIRENFSEAPPEHFAIVRPPHQNDFDSKEQFEARLTQHKLWADDLQRYGLRVVEIDRYDEVPELLTELERRVAKRRVWVSGSWPVGEEGATRAEFIHEVAQGIGAALGTAGYTLVSGAGLLVGSAALSGFLSSLQKTGSWDLERRLIARPFPQALRDQEPNAAQWQLLRTELGRLSGIAVFIGGMKVHADGALVPANGVLAEFDIARASGSFVLPIGATGGAASLIAERLLSMPASHRVEIACPTVAQLRRLSNEKLSASELVATAMEIVLKHARL
ncbi:SIR2 family protein [Bradyrhizobium sp. USDA 313]|uniref:SIR2 family protein n=1 Tax=Bradyrhizobium sp. USDA 313 TaxID=3156307 RepID=UPI003517E409